MPTPEEQKLYHDMLEKLKEQGAENPIILDVTLQEDAAIHPDPDWDVPTPEQFAELQEILNRDEPPDDIPDPPSYVRPKF